MTGREIVEAGLEYLIAFMLGVIVTIFIKRNCNE